MASSTSIRAPDRFAAHSDARSRVCSLVFRPSRFFVCRIEEVVADFFSCDDLSLAAMPEAAWDLLHNTVRIMLDERVTVDAVFSPAIAQGHVHVCLYYRLPTTEFGSTERALRLLERCSASNGYYRFGSGTALPLRAISRVQSNVMGFRGGESLMVTSLFLNLAVVQTDGAPVRLSNEK